MEPAENFYELLEVESTASFEEVQQAYEKKLEEVHEESLASYSLCPVDENEDFLRAAKRELEEETGIKSVKLIKELDGWFKYDLPKYLLGKLWKGKYRGQKQKWFVMKFLGNSNEINVKTKNPEFFDWKWIELSKLPNVAVHFKVDIYKKIKKKLTSLNLN